MSFFSIDLKKITRLRRESLLQRRDMRGGSLKRLLSRRHLCLKGKRNRSFRVILGGTEGTFGREGRDGGVKQFTPYI